MRKILSFFNKIELCNNYEKVYTGCENLVFIIPGAMQFTRILSSASSSAVTLVNPNKAVLLTEYKPNN